MNDRNLTPFDARTESEQREIRSKGGIASGKARRAKRDMAQLAERMLAQGLGDAHREQLAELFPDLDGDATMAAQVVAGQIRAAMRGGTAAARFLTDLQDRAKGKDAPKPYAMDPMDLTVDCIAPYRAIHQFFDGTLALDDMVFKGGRGGAKSTFAAQLAYEAMEQDPNANVVYGRRYATDLRHTVFTAFTRLLNEKGAMGEWEVTKSPMKCTRKASGTSVYFFGFDNAEQLKSFVPERGYVKLLIFEEADEMLGDEQMDSASDTFLRANGYEGARQLRLKVFNPPPSKSNFMNEWVASHVGDERVAVFDFSYLHVPPEWLGQVFLDRADRAKREKPEWYRNNYLGEVTGEGGELFSNVVERTISDDELERLEDGCHQGLDFGYEHPMAFVRVHYDPETDTVTPFFEHVKVRSKLSDFCKEIDRYRLQETVCDSAEPDRIAELLDWDWDAVKAVKSWKGGGRAFSWEWLRQRRAIVVDPERTPNLARELRTLEFEKVKGGYSSRYPDLGEDCVMATIYALNRVIRSASVYDRY